MFNRKNETDVALQAQINKLLDLVEDLSPLDPEYKPTIKMIKDLKKMQSTHGRKPLDPNTILIAGTNLGGIVLILSYERANVIATKAVGFVSKLR